MTMTEIYVDVTYSINRFIQQTKEELEIEKMISEAMKKANL